MTKPTHPFGDDPNASKKPATDKVKPKSDNLSFQNVMRDQGTDRSAQPHLYKHGQAPQFQLKQSDFLHDREKPHQDLRQSVDNFLKQTAAPDDAKLSPLEKKELEKSRDNLSRFTSANDAFSKAIHLARLYRHLRYIDEAKLATDLSLGIDPEAEYGQELFKELERMHMPDITISAPRVQQNLISKSNLRRRIIELSRGRVIVLGDLLIDELIYGNPERISREAPVLILEHEETELIPGGAANTAANIAALGGACHAIGVTGEDEYSEKLAGLFNSLGITHGLVQDPSRPTTVKTRVLSKQHSFRQQLLRIDRISHKPINALIEQYVTEKLEKVASQFKAVVLSDYRAGVITDGMIRAVRSVSKSTDLMVVVDAQGNFGRFQHATLLTPNQPDTEASVGYEIDSPETLRKAGADILVLTGAKAVLVTRGSEGMVLFQQGHEPVELPAFNRSEVFDVTGAGDTVAACMSLALTTGCTFVEAMAIGNLAAGIVVKKQGTATTNQMEMLEVLASSKIED